MSDKYIIRITAGPDYDEADHVLVPVNQPETVRINSDLADVELSVRIRDYHGLPRGSPSTSPYFTAEPHAYNQDQYSISFRFTPKKPASSAASGGSDEGGAEDGINGMDLQFGNDFDHPIRDRLPPGFNTAMSIVRWWVDPGLDGDAYADRPHLYGPALSSFNQFRVGVGEHDEAKGGLWIEEGGDDRHDDSGGQREDAGMPADGKARMKWALTDKNKQGWTFAYGQTYGFDFFNPYLDFSSLALRLPGFHLPIMKYWDGQGLRPEDARRSHKLRYVLRNKSTAQAYLVIVITVYRKEDVNEDGSLKEGAEERVVAAAHGGENVASPPSGGDKDKAKETGSDDVD